MEENLIGYLLGALDERTRQQVETYLRQDPEARQKLALLKQALLPLAADQEAPPPPPALAVRTLAKIAEHACDDQKGQELPSDLPHAPPISSATRSPGRSWWRRADVLMAACLLFMVAGVGSIVLGQLRGSKSSLMIADCQNNLRLFFTALQQYRDIHGQLPDMTREAPRNVAGMVVPILMDAGTLPADASIRCPGNGAPAACHLSLSALRSLSDTDFARCSPCLSMCYAYSLGYRDDHGAYHGPGAQTDMALSQLPIMADRPPSEGVVSNSVNHGGIGQNVLFSDGHVAFLPQRSFGGEDDIFMNRLHKVAAGLDAGDIVLGYSAARP